MSTEWADKAERCQRAEDGFEPYHKWIPISTSKSSGGENVETLMCGICFYEINITEAFKNRTIYDIS